LFIHRIGCICGLIPVKYTIYSTTFGNKKDKNLYDFENSLDNRVTNEGMIKRIGNEGVVLHDR